MDEITIQRLKEECLFKLNIYTKMAVTFKDPTLQYLYRGKVIGICEVGMFLKLDIDFNHFLNQIDYE